MRYWPALAALALIAAGCAKKEPVDATPNSTVTVQQKGDQTMGTYRGKGASATETLNDKTGGAKVAYKGDKGDTASVDTQADIDPKELGVDLYPGATRLHGEGDSTRDQEGDAVNITVRLSTPDKPAAVVEFYKKRIKEAHVDMLGQFQTVTGKNAAGDPVTVSTDPTKRKGATEITIMVMKKR